MGKSHFQKFAETLKDPVKEVINGKVKTYNISWERLAKEFGKSQETARYKMKRSGGDWTLADICAFARAAEIEVDEILAGVKSTTY